MAVRLASRELAVEGEWDVVGRLRPRQLAEVGRVEDEQDDYLIAVLEGIYMPPASRRS